MYTYPHTIENKHGEKIIFLRRTIKDGVETLETEGVVQPKGGPPIHVHWQQEESLTVVKGKMGTEIEGQEAVYYGPGETATFMRGTWHRFWNAGEDELKITGWIRPPHNFEYFITKMYEALNNGKGDRPEMTLSAFLMTRYKSEFGMKGMPGFVKNVIIPISYFFGKISGAHKKFKDAPAPLK